MGIPRVWTGIPPTNCLIPPVYRGISANSWRIPANFPNNSAKLLFILPFYKKIKTIPA
jgi:hypothetical protein